MEDACREERISAIRVGAASSVIQEDEDGGAACWQA